MINKIFELIGIREPYHTISVAGFHKRTLSKSECREIEKALKQLKNRLDTEAPMRDGLTQLTRSPWSGTWLCCTSEARRVGNIVGKNKQGDLRILNALNEAFIVQYEKRYSMRVGISPVYTELHRGYSHPVSTVSKIILATGGELDNATIRRRLFDFWCINLIGKTL